MFPAHNEVARGRIVTVQPEIAALELQLDPHPFPALGDLPASDTVRKRRPNFLDNEADFLADFGEDGHYTHLVHGAIDEPAKVDNVADDAGFRHGSHFRPTTIRLFPAIDPGDLTSTQVHSSSSSRSSTSRST